MKVQVDASDTQRLIEILGGLANTLISDYVEVPMQAGAEIVLAGIEKKIPVGTAPDKHPGLLKGAFHIETISRSATGLEKGIFVDPDAFYWRYVEKGHAGPGGSEKRTPAHEYVRPGYKGSRFAASGVIRDTFRDLILGFTAE